MLTQHRFVFCKGYVHGRLDDRQDELRAVPTMPAGTLPLLIARFTPPAIYLAAMHTQRERIPHVICVHTSIALSAIRFLKHLDIRTFNLDCKEEVFFALRITLYIGTLDTFCPSLVSLRYRLPRGKRNHISLSANTLRRICYLFSLNQTG